MNNPDSEIHQWLREEQTNVYVTEARGRNTSTYNEIDFNRDKDIAIVMGSEANGVSDKFKLSYDDISTYLNIPIQSESLNVGVACGILLSEVRRQQGRK